MARKGFQSVEELRGMLSVPLGTDAAEHERAGSVTGLGAANVRACTRWYGSKSSAAHQSDTHAAFRAR